MFPGLVDHLWQSTLFVGAAWVLTLALKKNRAQVRYWVWFTASVKFLAPLALLVAVGELAPKHAARPMAQAQWVVAVEQIGEPLATLPAARVSVERTNRNYFVPLAAGVWVCGFLGVTICWLARWRRVGALRRLATPVRGLEFAVPVMSSSGLIEPGIFGIFRPVLLLPEGIGERLAAAQLDAILAHELCHVRRKDNLTATIHMVVQAIFWFHPLVWWLGARLVDERERACDEEVLRLGSKPGVYAEGILNVCKLYVESPLACVSGVTGSNLKRRIEAIMKNRNVRGLSFAKKTALAVAGLAAVALPIAVGVLHAQSAAATPKFEVASIRAIPGPVGFHNTTFDLTHGRLTAGYAAVRQLTGLAYGVQRVRVEGGPAWVDSDLFDITAKAESPDAMPAEIRAMLQTLLADRFRLAVHRETKQLQGYTLIVGKNGSKFRKRRTRESHLRSQGSQVSLIFHDMSLGGLVNYLANILGGPVQDRTGLSKLYNFKLDYAAFGDTRPDSGPSLLVAVEEQLGLKLESAKVPTEVLVIDHVEKPSAN